MQMLGFTAFRAITAASWTTIIFLVLITPLVVIHETVPTPNDAEYPSVNLTQAWADLVQLTRYYHPFNSRGNDETREFLLQRVRAILAANVADESRVALFDDQSSNLTAWQGAGSDAVGVYYEGNNLVVYIRGKTDPEGDWWRHHQERDNLDSHGVLVNAHFDSASTSYGATDAGMGAVTVLQLINYFTAPGNQPTRGIVALLNNNEEDYAWGARAFASSPLMPFCDVFLNLEGAGAGGRATVFRATDVEIMRSLSGAPHPSSNSVSSDLWDSGVVRSGTDYSVFTMDFDMRGMDMAFFHRRARYHTNQDDARHTSPEALWHMLSNSIHILTQLSSSDSGSVPRSTGVWFDIFGKGFVSFGLRSMFAWTLTLLLIGPLIVMGFAYALFRVNKPRLIWTTKANMIKDIFAFPCALAVAVLSLYACSALLIAINPHVMQDHQYSVWAMFLLVTYLSIWVISSQGSDDTSLRRHISILWLFIIAWICLAVTAVREQAYHSAITYGFILSFPLIFICVLITIFELLSPLPDESYSDSTTHNGTAATQTHRMFTEGERGELETDDNLTNETTPLLGARATTPMVKYRHLLNSLWLVQLFLLVPANVMIFGQIALLLVSGTAETGVEDVNLWTPFKLVAVFSFVLLLPMSPFIYRVHRAIPATLVVFLIFMTIFNLVVFPFSADARCKIFMQQRVDLDTGESRLYYKGPERYIRHIVSHLPSAMGKEVSCTAVVPERPDLLLCSYDGNNVFSNVVKKAPNKGSRGTQSPDWIEVKASSTKEKPRKASIKIDALESRTCGLELSANITSFKVRGGSGSDGSFGDAPKSGFSHITLYRRNWDNPWLVDIASDDADLQGLEGRVFCNWDDVNSPGVIPAYDENLQYGLDWVAVTKLTTGILQGTKQFRITASDR